MISATRRWLRRNRSGIAIGAAVVGGTYLVGQYVVGKINEARERSQLDRIAKENIRRRFEQNQTDCTITVLALLPTLTENVLDALPVEQLTHELQQKKAERLARSSGEGASEVSSLRDGDTASISSFQTGSFLHASQLTDAGQSQPRRSKAQLWNELKVQSVTRAFTLIYALSLLTILTRIQLNLLGRLNYLSSVITLAQPPVPGRSNSISLEDHDDANANLNFGNDFETNRRYLTFSWFLLHKGYAQIMARVRIAVEKVFGAVSPTEGLTAAKLSELVLAVRREVEGATEQERYATRWLPYLLPPREQEESILVESGVITPPSSSSATTPDAPGTSQYNQPTTSYVDTSSGPLRQLLDETADLIDSPTFTRIHTLLLNTLFSNLIDKNVIAASYPQQPPTQNPTPSLYETSQQRGLPDLDSAVTVVPAEPRVRLASILAIFARQAHIIGNGNNPPNEYLANAEEEVKELESFAAVIYTSNLEQSIEESRSKIEQEAESQSRSRSQSQQQQRRQSSGSVGGDGKSDERKSFADTAVSDVGPTHMDEMVESKLESAWMKVTGGTSFASSR